MLVANENSSLMAVCDGHDGRSCSQIFERKPDRCHDQRMSQEWAHDSADSTVCSTALLCQM